MPLNVAIVGAGVMGRTLAWQLLEDAGQRGLPVRISVFDRDPIEHGGAAAYTAAGMLTPYCEVESAETEVFELGMQALKRWPLLAASLGEDIGFRQGGSLVVAHSGDRADYQRFQRQLRHKLGDLEGDVDADVQTLDREGLQRACPELAERFSEAVSISREAWVNSRLYMSVIARRLRERGVEWHPCCEVIALRSTGAGAAIEVADGRELTFDHLFDCRGLGAKADIPALRGVRGEVITVHAPDVNIDCLVRLMHPRYRLYLVPRGDHTYVLGATQIESDDRGPVTVRSALELLSALYSLHAGFAEARVVETDSNCRPALRDNLPCISTTGQLTRINGLYRHGYLLAPVLAAAAAERLYGLADQQIVNA